MFNKALKYLTNNRPEKAIPLFKKILKESPYKEVYLNLGNCYKILDNDDAAREMYLAAADSNVPFTDNTFVDVYPEALNNLGMLASKYKNYDVATEFFLKALEKNPNYKDAAWNLSNVTLMHYCNSVAEHDWLTAWTLYENRFHRSNNAVILKSKKPLKPWNGEFVDSLAILVEQGFGDQLMFGRYLDLAAARCNKLYIQCDPKMDVIFDKYNTCRDPIDAEYGIGICSLGRIFHEKIPEGNWLHDKYTPKTLSTLLQIGVTWSGNPNHANDRNRSTNPRTFRSMGDYGSLYTLNPTEVGTPGFTSLKASGWADTISELEKVDLVVSVDTSIVHLCGALGKPCWALMPLHEPDWRWGITGSTNIWYPSVRIFRNNGSWDAVMKEVNSELKKLSDAIRSV